MNPHIDRVPTVIRFPPRAPLGRPMATPTPWWKALWRSITGRRGVNIAKWRMAKARREASRG